MLEKYKLDDRVLEWVEAELAVDTLLSRKMPKIEFDKGVFWTFAPAGMDAEKLYRFSEGGILPAEAKDSFILYHSDYRIERKNSCIDELTCYLASLCNRADVSAYLFDDVMARSDDAHLNDFSYIEKDEVFHILDAQLGAEEDIKELTISTNSSWHFLCVGLERSCSFPIMSGAFEKLPEAITILVLGAYDGEGFVIWEHK